MVLPANRKRIVTQRITTFDEFRDAASAYRLPRVLLAALELDLFTTVGDRSWTIPDLAKELKVSERGLSILCRNLAAVGVLQKKGAGYKNSRLGATALNADHRAYRGGYLNLIKSHWADWIRLLESVRSGLPIDHETPDSPDVPSTIHMGHAPQDLGNCPGDCGSDFVNSFQNTVGPRWRARHLCHGVSLEESHASCHRLRSRGRS